MNPTPTVFGSPVGARFIEPAFALVVVEDPSGITSATSIKLSVKQTLKSVAYPFVYKREHLLHQHSNKITEKIS